MNRMMGQLAFVVVAMLLGGQLGAWTGEEVGRQSPTVVRTIAGDGPSYKLPPGFLPEEFGRGLGALCGLFFGCGSALFLIALSTLREALAGWPEALRIVARDRVGARSPRG